MSMFAKYLSIALESQAVDMEDDAMNTDPLETPADMPAEETVVTEDTPKGETAEVAVDMPAGEADDDDAYAEQRARLNQNLVQENEPVDGSDDDMTVGETETDMPVVEGEFNAMDDMDMDEMDMVPDMDRDLDTVEDEAEEIEALDMEMSQLMQAGMAIEQFGINPTALAIGQATGLFNSTALESLGLESIQFHSGKDAESHMALEAIADKIKEKAAKWSAKILSVAKGAGEKILKALGALWDKIEGSVKFLASKSWDAAKAAGRTVKAHPIKTVLAMIAAVAAVAAIVAFAGAGMPALGAQGEAMMKFAKELAGKITKIKLPFGKVAASVKDSGQLLFEYNPGEALGSAAQYASKAETVSKLGWTKSAVSSVASQLTKAWTALKTGWGALSARAVKVATSTKDLASGTATLARGGGKFYGAIGKEIGKGAANAVGVTGKAADAASKVGSFVFSSIYWSMIVNFVHVLFILTRSVVMGAFRLVSATLRALMGAGKVEA